MFVFVAQVTSSTVSAVGC